MQVIDRFDPDHVGELDFVNFTALVSGSGEDDGTSFESPTTRKPKKRKNVRVSSRPTSIGSIPVRACVQLLVIITADIAGSDALPPFFNPACDRWYDRRVASRTKSWTDRALAF
jgi:hypothetical protein